MHTHVEDETVCEICVLDARIHLAFVERKLEIERQRLKNEARKEGLI